ncbi:Hypothetical protein I5071_68180 [Sandaracinus amylolyticus]|nr:Hypothetical protein I5071_68180 [Sandaracinus amylolyticus]
MRDVEISGPTQVLLRSIYEARGVRYQLQPALQRTLEDVPGPDPWSAPLRQPEGAAVGHELTFVMHGHHVPMDCGVCSATGETSCVACEGTGRVQSGNRSHACATCGARGFVRCAMCHGSGGLIGHPTIWSRIEAHHEVRTIGTDDLPLDVAVDLTGANDDGEVVHRQEGSRVLEMRSEGGYRDAARAHDAIARTARALCDHPGVPDRARIVSQVLEVRRVPVLVLRLEDGRTIHAWGEPPQISPPRALDSTALVVLRASPWLALASSIAAAATYWLSG